MKKIEKVINQSALNVFKYKPTQFLIGFYKKSAKDAQDIKINIKTELDFFNAAIIIESFKNKKLFEETYERERKELTDLWPALSYQEKNKLINLKLDETKNRCRSFQSEKGKKIWIAFFDELLNTLYDKEMNIFDLDQYFNLYKDFKKRMIPTSTYGIYPYRSEFIDIKRIDFSEHQVLFYYDPLKTIYLIKEVQGVLDLKKIALRPDYLYQTSDHKKFIQLMDLLVSRQKNDLIDALLDSQLITDKVRKALLRMNIKSK